MITYDGVRMDSIASVQIEDIRISPIKFEPVARSRPVKAGSDFVRNRKGTRTVVVTFVLLDENEVNRQQSIIELCAWAKDDKEYKIQLDNYPGLFLTGICTQKPEVSLREWWQSIQFVFTCFNDPFWNSVSEKSASCGTDFYVLGDAPPLMRIERTLGSSASNQSYGLNGNTITFSTIPAGNLVIDLDKETAVVGSTDIMQYYNMNSRFLVPKTGSQKVTGTGTVKYRERWE